MGGVYDFLGASAKIPRDRRSSEPLRYEECVTHISVTLTLQIKMDSLQEKNKTHTEADEQ